MRSQRHDAPGAENSFELDTNNTLVGFASGITASFGAGGGGGLRRSRWWWGGL